MEMTIKRSSDGVPQFAGEPELLPMYREEALQYMMTLEVKKRYLAGPRLAKKELTGVAKVAIRNRTTQDPQWLAHPRGAYTLLEFLESFLAKPTLVEASRFIMKFFYNLRRKKGETMTEWVARHAEALWEASQATRKVQKKYGGKPSASGLSHGPPVRQWWSRTTNSVPSGRTSGRTSEVGQETGHEEGGDGTDDPETTEDADGEEEAGQDEVWNSWRRNSWSGWSGWSGGYWSAWSDWSDSWKSQEHEPPDSWDKSAEPFLPEFLAGFLLLNRAGLDAHERANILAAIRGEFSTTTVGRALREQWSDDDLARRDKAKMGTSYYVSEDYEDEALAAEDSFQDLDGFDEETKEAYMLEQERAEDALAVINAQKATLREARWRQKEIKLGRQFYPKGGKGGSSSKGGSGKGAIQCFRCGGNHRVAECPQREKNQQANFAEATEFAFSADDVEEVAFHAPAEQGHDNNNLVEHTMGVIDCGATSSLGSIEALEAVAEKNLRDLGDSKILVDTQRKPVFRFGNGQRKTCQPILVSRKALRALGAVIDFRSNKVIYQNVDPSRVVSLQEAPNGHQLMPMTGDFLAGAEVRGVPFNGLLGE
ncbi:unnamed protein product [Symbiodinium pilosum]|uniref:Uncharacterized protein n=1 Tax=Symbiodinium pilosum TaxID=2952 RepID=A0A812QJB7_SYMPI|nr:unnamed protein product [Symbiodinium pilosum]